MDNFWLIWREDGGVPTRKHFSAEAARREAKRLAQKHPGKEFYVLRKTSLFITPNTMKRKLKKSIELTAEDLEGLPAELIKQLNLSGVSVA